MNDLNRLRKYFEYILNAIDNIEKYYKEINSCEKLILNTMVTDAILMQLQHLGESMNKVNKYYKKNI